MGDRGRVPASPDCGIRRKRWMVGEILRRVEGRREFAVTRNCYILANSATGETGLKVGVEVSVGRNWQSFNVDKNPEGMRELSGKELKEEYGL